MTVAPTTKTKWTLDEVERLGAFMAKHGISLIALPGLKLMRHPQEHAAQATGQAIAEAVIAASSGKRQPTDEELLFNPLAGLSSEVEGSLNG